MQNTKNPEASRLEAVMALLFAAADTGDEAKLEEAKELARMIQGMTPEQIQKLIAEADGGQEPEEEQPAAPIQQGRRGSFLAYLRGDDGARAWARFLAEFFSLLEEAGKGPGKDTVLEARHELEPEGWTLKRHGDRKWYAVDGGGQGGQYKKVPVGTPGAIAKTDSLGRTYYDIPAGDEEERADPKAAAGRAAKRWKSKKIDPHRGGRWRKRGRKAGRKARLALGVVQQAYGKQAVERLADLIELGEKALGGAEGRGLRKRLTEALGWLCGMAVLAEGEDGEEEVGVEIVEQVTGSLEERYRGKVSANLRGYASKGDEEIRSRIDRIDRFVQEGLYGEDASAEERLALTQALFAEKAGLLKLLEE